MLNVHQMFGCLNLCWQKQSEMMWDDLKLLMFVSCVFSHWNTECVCVHKPPCDPAVRVRDNRQLPWLGQPCMCWKLSLNLSLLVSGCGVSASHCFLWTVCTVLVWLLWAAHPVQLLHVLSSSNGLCNIWLRDRQLMISCLLDPTGTFAEMLLTEKQGSKRIEKEKCRSLC